MATAGIAASRLKFETLRVQTSTGNNALLGMRRQYEDLLILKEENASSLCPAMSQETIFEAINYKRAMHGKILRDMHKNPVNDANGHPILCQGGWNAPIQVKGMLAAVSALHKARSHSGPVLDNWAEEETNETRQTRIEGCILHRGMQRLMRTGHVSQVQAILNQVADSDANAAKSGYVEKGDSPFNPLELL
ncbi:hypothetical protein HK100_004616 [Physocladia obscura]|uniref:Uncharacterized protein n=1 Tax=Physocladia obscura TaxID=109957 RepID=A0AAD5SSP0_9FUNG|nr:hypothetical protein HK100_004616 [Physocladia obscura]